MPTTTPENHDIPQDDNPTQPDAVALAAMDVPVEAFHGDDGRAIRPCTPAAVTRRHLRLLDVRPGHHVLDIGIGSGYSAALLARLVGPTGRASAIDIDPDIARRAEALFAEHHLDVTVDVGDGHLGRPTGAPYDRILVGTTPPAIPHTWLDQLRPGGTLLAGVRLGDLPGSYAIATITVDDHHQPARTTIHHGGYTPMTTPPSPTRQRPHPRPEARTNLTRLLPNPHVEPTTAPDHDYPHAKNWLIATYPGDLIEAALSQDAGVGIILSGPGRSTHAALITDQHLITDQLDSPAATMLRAHLDRWRDAGSPRTNQLPCRLTRYDHGWQAQILPP
jgi:protein-L-isoaspartate(D-aspartate) O-methyltransferase